MITTRRRTDQPTLRTAAYLRCFPYDDVGTGPHHNAVLAHAESRSLPVPAIYFDNGRLASGPLPELERLLRAVAAGHYDAVLVPEPFVLSLLDDRKAQAIVREIAGHGCQVIEVPSLHTRTEGRLTEQPKPATERRPLTETLPAPSPVHGASAAVKA